MAVFTRHVVPIGDDGAESCSVPFCDRALFGIETNNEAWPVPKLNRPVTDKEFSPLDCFGVVGANQEARILENGRQDQWYKLGSLPSIAFRAKNSISDTSPSAPRRPLIRRRAKPDDRSPRRRSNRWQYPQSTTARALKEPKPAIDIVSAMNDPALFADWFQGESWDGWRAVLKAAYALAELAPAALRRSANKRSSDDIS
jgi:hypothetical protein